MVCNYTRHDLSTGINDSHLDNLALTIKNELSELNKRTKRVFSLTGGSGCGLREIIASIGKQLPHHVTHDVLSVSNYYQARVNARPGQSAGRFGGVDFDSPALFDYQRMARDVETLMNGHDVKEPQYDKESHEAVGERHVSPPEVLFLQGTYLLVDARIRRLSNQCFFLDMADDVRFARRLSIDVVEYGYHLDDALQYYFHRVKTGYKHYLEPIKNSKRGVTVIEVPGEQPESVYFDEPATDILEIIKADPEMSARFKSL